MEDLLASVNDHGPDLVVFSGDFTQRARHIEFAEARRFLDRISEPKLVTPGNHDVPLYNVLARFLNPFKKYDHYVAPVGHPANFFRDKELAVLGLNTARPFARKNGRLSLEQIEEMGQFFRDVPEGVIKALVTHHPLGIPRGEAPLELAGRSQLALDELSKVGIHLLLSGHHHRALSGDLSQIGGEGSMLVLHAGTAISTRPRGSEGNTYNLVCTTKDQVSVRVMGWMAGRGFREVREASYVFVERRWRARE